MSMTVGDFLFKRLSEWGVRRIFGYPGDGINGLMGALARAGDRFKLVRTSHEEMAAFMACAHAKFTGEVGVCLATSGPGAIHLLNGLYDAKMDHQPVVALVGQQSRKALGGSYQQEVDLLSLFKDVAHQYVHMVSDPTQVRHLVDRAFRIAKAERTVTCLIFPNDVQDMDAVETPPRAHGTVHSSYAYSTPRVIPRGVDLDRAAEILNAGKKVAMLVGAGALGASAEVLKVADLLGAGIAKALLIGWYLRGNDMAKSGGKTAGFSIALGMCPEGVGGQEGEGRTNGTQEMTAAFKERRQYRVEEMLGRGGGSLGG